MPRAFLITNRRYKTVVEYDSRDNSPDRLSVRSSDGHATAPRTHEAVPNLNTDSTPYQTFYNGLNRLSSLEQLAEISLATAHRWHLSPPSSPETEPATAGHYHPALHDAARKKLHRFFPVARHGLLLHRNPTHLSPTPTGHHRIAADERSSPSSCGSDDGLGEDLDLQPRPGAKFSFHRSSSRPRVPNHNTHFRHYIRQQHQDPHFLNRASPSPSGVLQINLDDEDNDDDGLADESTASEDLVGDEDMAMDGGEGEGLVDDDRSATGSDYNSSMWGTEESGSPDGNGGHDLHPGDSGESNVCPECGKRYSTSSNLARHRQTHRSMSDKKARKCPHCDKVYVSMPAYSMHVRTHGQGCQCPFCGKCFSRPWLLQGHIRTHTGEKPFKCHVCSKAFADKSNLRAHIQTHSDTKPYVCQRCGKAFALKSYLYKHEESSCMRSHSRPSETHGEAI